jgi:hypothetical protein
VNPITQADLCHQFQNPPDVLTRSRDHSGDVWKVADQQRYGTHNILWPLLLDDSADKQQKRTIPGSITVTHLTDHIGTWPSAQIDAHWHPTYPYATASNLTGSLFRRRAVDGNCV